MSSSSSCVYVRDVTHGWLPATVVSREGTMARVSVSLPADDGREGSGSSSGGSGGNIIFEERDIDTSEVPKRGSKILLGYEGGRLPIRNVDGGGNELEVADMCDLPSLHEVRSYLRLIDD